MTTHPSVINPAQLPTPESWQQALANVVRQPEELFDLLQLDKSSLPAALAASQDFALRVPRAFVARMKTGCADDPLLKQVLPLGAELDYQPGFSEDPLGEMDCNPVPGLIHKYHGRVLLIVSGGCAINCRYCFRRHFPYSDNNPGRSERQQMLDYIRSDSSIHEVILSGGDPLAASDILLAELVEELAAIPHLTTLRVHSRMPVVIPQRITSQCLQWLTATRLNTVMVVHCNHANEIDQTVQDSLHRLKYAGITVLNQTVLLAGINDNADSLAELSERLFAAGALPYYLHTLDKVQGAGHFQVPEEVGQQLITALLARLPGYLVPKLVKEMAGARSKVPVSYGVSLADRP
ncbi:EF-P beta-lysylation protein EpmB [Oceanicoccus sagamiensis]|uniref:L-lysine 2,3-aminomutase n=1 Tax=Oceanicoccus sagamiensis TaxID=716816 RepID=A0A1X9N794_9GAMM|nr:EF-P beta-lysylation protein EpmB [Oceanicoccus sagamiensis]ARN73556.1 EF-P beta-lysylation protein EpmB [Oceanicoccus sagamiensis]